MTMIYKNIGLFFLLSSFISCAYGQTNPYIDEDHRISQYQKSMTEYLAAKKQFTSDTLSFDDYLARMYIRKELEIFRDSVLIVRFGSLGDHADAFLGILSKNDKILLIDNEWDSLNRFMGKFSPSTRNTILTFIETLWIPLDRRMQHNGSLGRGALDRTGSPNGT